MLKFNGSRFPIKKTKCSCTDNEMKLLELLKINPNITQVELSNKLNVSRRPISTLLADLKEKVKGIRLDRKEYLKIK